MAHPDKSIERLSLVTPEDKNRLPDPAVAIEKPVHRPVTELFRQTAERHPKLTAVRQGQRAWSYQETLRNANALAYDLAARGIKKGDVVAVTGASSFGTVVSMLGVLSAGAILAPVDADLPDRRRELLLRESRASLLIRIGPRRPDDGIPDGLEVLDFDPAERPATETAQAAALPAVGPEDPAYIFFTSGTTGTPKGVLGTHSGLSHFVSWEIDRLSVGTGDRIAQLTNLSFDPVLRDIFVPLVAGAAVCLPDDRVTLDTTIDWLRREQITILHTVPSLVRAWLDSRNTEIALDSLRWVLFAGELLTGELVSRFRQQVGGEYRAANLYGPTESTMVKAFGVVSRQPDPGPLPVGHPLPNTQLLVVGENDRLCGAGETGEILIRTPFLTQGYINNAIENERRFVLNPFREDPGDIVYRTGDLGRYRPDGSLEVVGRTDAQLKVRGVRVEPEEISSVLARHPQVKSCHVCGWEPESGQKELAAYVVREAANGVEIPELVAYLTRLLPPAMIPSSYSFVERLPLTPNGKIDRRALPRPTPPAVVQRAASRSAWNQLERDLADIWSQILRVENVGVEDNFFALGGHSLRAVQVIARIRQDLGLDLPLRKIFERPTVAALAEFLQESRSEEDPLEELLSEIEGMTEEEAASMLGEGEQ